MRGTVHALDDRLQDVKALADEDHKEDAASLLELVSLEAELNPVLSDDAAKKQTWVECHAARKKVELRNALRRLRSATPTQPTLTGDLPGVPTPRMTTGAADRTASSVRAPVFFQSSPPAGLPPVECFARWLRRSGRAAHRDRCLRVHQGVRRFGRVARRDKRHTRRRTG